MTNINHALEAKAQKSLNIRVRYDEGIMTRKEWIELKHKQGASVEESTKNKVAFNRIKFNRMDYKEQEVYEKKCNEKVTCYNLHQKGETSYWEITKTEFDYFNQLDIENDEKCVECGKEMDEMEHNYGTEELFCCIHCYNDAQN